MWNLSSGCGVEGRQFYPVGSECCCLHRMVAMWRPTLCSWHQRPIHWLLGRRELQRLLGQSGKLNALSFSFSVSCHQGWANPVVVYVFRKILTYFSSFWGLAKFYMCFASFPSLIINIKPMCMKQNGNLIAIFIFIYINASHSCVEKGRLYLVSVFEDGL